MTDTRTFIKVHDAILDNPKIEVLSDKAFRHLIGLWCHCARNLTDGQVSDRAWKRLTSPKTAAELVKNGLVSVRDGGYEMHDYLQHQRSRAEVEDLQEKRRSAGRRGGIAKANKQASAMASATASAVANGKQISSREEKRREEPPLPPALAAPPSGERSPADAGGDPDFKQFWDLYPRHTDEPAARSAWRRASRDTEPEVILAGLQATLPRFEETEPRFIPTAVTWLRGRRWTEPPDEEPDSWKVDRPENWRELLAEQAASSGPMWDKPPPEPPAPSRMPDSVRAAIRRPHPQRPTIRPTGSETP